jgi:hypothetical protein
VKLQLIVVANSPDKTVALAGLERWKDAGAKGSVSANINAAKEDDESHTPDYEEKSQDVLWPLTFATVHGLAPSRLAINIEVRLRLSSGSPPKKVNRS